MGYKTIEEDLRVPIFGNRSLFQAEERDHPRNQYYLLEKAGIRLPRLFKDPQDINAPSIIKVQEKERRLERAFFTVSSYQDYQKKSKRGSVRG